jgi:hypothetical protein
LWKKNRMTFLLVYDSHTGSFLVAFHKYRYYTQIWFISSFFFFLP